MTLKIKPCPFCNATAKLHKKESEDNNESKMYFIWAAHSDSCYLKFSKIYSFEKDSLITTWNRRVGAR